MNGVFAGTLFGPRDGWAAGPDMTFPALADVPALLPGFDLEVLEQFTE
ncbi:hypothetical protein [Deinococcus sp.]|nr:hypothetical protein [Deinococcus sp.]